MRLLARCDGNAEVDETSSAQAREMAGVDQNPASVGEVSCQPLVSGMLPSVGQGSLKCGGAQDGKVSAGKAACVNDSCPSTLTACTLSCLQREP